MTGSSGLGVCAHTEQYLTGILRWRADRARAAPSPLPFWGPLESSLTPWGGLAMPPGHTRLKATGVVFPPCTEAVPTVSARLLKVPVTLHHPWVDGPLSPEC